LEVGMNAGELCNREVILAYRDTRLVEAARLMREHHVGSLVVVVDRLSERVPVGILTDRDVVVAVVAKELDPRALTVGDVMTGGLVTVREQDGIADALRLMRERGVRRLPVLTRSGALAGILTLDDLLELVAEELGNFASIINRERVREVQKRSR
jgi:CBS domain-containing protein